MNSKWQQVDHVVFTKTAKSRQTDVILLFIVYRNMNYDVLFEGYVSIFVLVGTLHGHYIPI